MVCNYGIQKDSSKWILSPKKGTVTNNGDGVSPKKVIEVSPKKGHTKETSSKETIQKKTSRTFEKCEVVYQLTIYLEGKIMENNKSVQKRTELQLQNWCKDIDKLLRLDKATSEDVKQIIDWVVKDDFWSPNIMSAEKLRKHYTRLYKKVITNTIHDPDRFDFINEEENLIEQKNIFRNDRNL